MQNTKTVSNPAIPGNVLRAAALICSMMFFTAHVSTALAQPAQGPWNTSARLDSAPPRHDKVSPYRPIKVPSRARDYYRSIWGVDHMRVSLTESGNLIRFSYRVTEPERATPLGDNHATPFMFGQRSHALLHVPVMEKVGQLRQMGVPVAGKEYWMVFSNKGSYVKPGDHVNVVIGAFHADGLMVE